MIFSNKKRGLWVGIFTGLLYGSFLVVILFTSHTKELNVSDVLSPKGADAYEYVSLAQTIVSAHRYALSPDSPPEYFRSPGYPVFAAGLLSFVNSPVVLIVAQIILIAICSGLIYVIGTQLFAQWVGFAAALAFIFDPTVITTSLITLSEPLFMALLLGVLWVILNCSSRNQAILAGLLLGTLILTRPVGIFLAPLFVCLLVYVAKGNAKKVLSYTVLFLGTSAIIFVPWMIRNAHLSGHFSLSSISTYNMLFYNLVEFKAQQGIPKEIFMHEIQDQLGSSDNLALRSFEYTQKESVLIHKYLDQHLFSYTTFHIFKTIPFFLGSSLDFAERHLVSLGLLDREVGSSVNISSLVLSGDVRDVISVMREHPWQTIERVCWLLIALTAFLAPLLMFYKKDQRWMIALLFLMFILLLAVLAGPVSHPRYRIPVEPFLFILSAGNIYVISKALRAIYLRKSS